MRQERHHGKFYIRSTGAAPGSKHYYRRVWSGGEWNQYILGHIVGSVIQVCCGGSQIGDVRVDRFRSAPCLNFLADMIHLPFRDRSFDTVACDPPYEITYPQRISLQREISRVASKRIIFKAPWIPRASGWALSDRSLTLVASHTVANVAVLSVLDRKPSEEMIKGIV